MEIRYTHKAFQHLEALPKVIQKRIAEKMRFYASQENPLRFAERLVEPREGDYRFRVGNYRIIFDVAGNKIYVLAIKKRDEAYP